MSLFQNQVMNLDPADYCSNAAFNSSYKHDIMSSITLSINNLPFNLNNDVMYPLDVMMLEVTETGYETQEAEIDISYDLSQLPKGLCWL